MVRAARKAAGIEPVFKRVDTCAAEFASIWRYSGSRIGISLSTASRKSPATWQPITETVATPAERTIAAVGVWKRGLTFASRRTNVLHGAVHVLLFLVYLGLIFD